MYTYVFSSVKIFFRQWESWWRRRGRALVPRRGHSDKGPGGGLLGAGTSEPEGEPEGRGKFSERPFFEPHL